MNSQLTRRSFVKHSIVAAVAVSSLTIFSGLVNAETEGGSGNKCRIVKLSGTQPPQACSWRLPINPATNQPYPPPFPGAPQSTMYLCMATCTPSREGNHPNGHPYLATFEVECDHNTGAIKTNDDVYWNTDGCEWQGEEQ